MRERLKLSRFLRTEADRLEEGRVAVLLENSRQMAERYLIELRRFCHERPGYGKHVNLGLTQKA